jgi:hypothetical protein
MAAQIFGIEWRPIPGFDRYEASEFGDIRRGLRILIPTEGRTGHLRVTVYAAGRQYRTGVHRLVCMTFHGLPPDDKPLACHENGVPGDNRPANLYWGDYDDNRADEIRHRVSGTKLRTFAWTRYGVGRRRAKQLHKINMLDRLERRKRTPLVRERSSVQS